MHLTDFTNAVERIVAGLEKKNRLPIPKERELIACYELGHAIVAMALPGQDPVHKISIISLVIGALGNTIQRPTERSLPDDGGRAGTAWRCCSAAALPNTSSSTTFRGAPLTMVKSHRYRAQHGAALRHG